MKLPVWLQSLFLSLVLISGFAFGADAPATVNINSADAQTLAESLIGVGEVRAREIVKWREAHGAFSSVEQLTDVKGVGAAVLQKNRDRIVLK